MPSPAKNFRTNSNNTAAAVLVIDFQNEFVRTDGKLHGDVVEMMKLTGMLRKVPRVVHVAR